MILGAAVITPLRVTFYEEDELAWVIVESFIDLMFAVDIVITFCSAYYDKMENLIYDRRQIACNYVSSWFVVDLFSILPLSLVFRNSANKFAKLVRLPRVF